MAFDKMDGHNFINAINALDKTRDAHMLTYLLLISAYKGDVQAVEAVLKKGIAIDTVEPTTGLAPLHVAVGRNNLAMTRYLVEHGAAFKGDKQGRWPTTIAALCEVDDDLCDYIVDAEARSIGHQT